MTTSPRTITEPMPFLQEEGAGHLLLRAMRDRHHAVDFADDEPTVDLSPVKER